MSRPSCSARSSQIHFLRPAESLRQQNRHNILSPFARPTAPAHTDIPGLFTQTAFQRHLSLRLPISVHLPLSVQMGRLVAELGLELLVPQQHISPHTMFSGPFHPRCIPGFKGIQLKTSLPLEPAEHPKVTSVFRTNTVMTTTL